MAAAANRAGTTSPRRVLRSTLASLLHDMFLRTFATKLSPSPEMVFPSEVRISKNSAPYSLSATGLGVSNL